MARRVVAGVLGGIAAPVTVNTEDFSAGFGSWTSPGVEAQPGEVAWTFNAAGGTPSGGTGPAGGANPVTGAVETTGNGYAYVESSDGGGAVSPYVLESEPWDASQFTYTLTFQLHANWNDANNAVFRVQGWNGSSWVNIGPSVTAELQADENAAWVASSTIGTFTSAGFGNTDFRFRFFQEKETVGPDRFQYDTAVDNVQVTRIGGTSPAELGFNTGLRRLHVSATSTPPLDGTTPDASFTTIQAALNAAQPGDVITVGAGTYRERPSLTNFAGTVALPLWIVAETRGAVTVSDLWEEADEGTVTWTADAGGGNVFFAARTDRPYIGSHNGTFLMAYKSEADLRAATITAPSAIAGGADRTISKPDYGFAFDQGENRVYVRLRDGSDPNGQSIKLNAIFERVVFDFNNADNVILDGFRIEGGGVGVAVDFDNSCANPMTRNLIFTHTRFGVRQPGNTLIEWCEYTYTGFGLWARDLFALDGLADHGVFVLLKGYYNGGDIPEAGGGTGNSLLEGSIDFARNVNPVPTGNETRFCLIGPAFDGSRLGGSNDSSFHDSVFLECLDDGLNFDGLSGHPSDGNECHDNLFRDCYRDVSFQASEMVGSGHVYRCVFDHTDNDLALRGASMKTISTPAAWSGFIYHCTWRMFFNPALSANLLVWDEFSGATPERILNFYNNILILSDDISGGHSSEKPQSIESNAVVGTSSGNVAVLTGGGGAFAGTAEADMELNSAFVPTGTSPAIGIGRSLVSGNPDSRSGAGVNDDAGAFPSGETPISPWPRPATTTFDTSLPERWTSPGA